jgi:hypothetical protein
LDIALRLEIKGSIILWRQFLSSRSGQQGGQPVSKSKITARDNHVQHINHLHCYSTSPAISLLKQQVVDEAEAEE